MPARYRLLLQALSLSALVLFFAAVAIPHWAHSQDATLPDPVPIRRVLLTPDRVPLEMERAKRGVLVQLPREQFESQVQRAAQAGEALKTQPRLVEARYVASLVDTSLVGGAEWKVINPAPSAGILPVKPFNLALLWARWSDNREALFGELEGKEAGLGLVVEPAKESAGSSALAFDWSARSQAAAGALRFSLEAPACAIAFLELSLPADRVVNLLRTSYLLSGPHPATENNRRLWRIGFAGQSQVNFEVRRGSGPDLPTPLILAGLQTRQELIPGQLVADFDFDLTVLHGGVKQLVCECTPGLWPTEVSIYGLEEWQLKPSPGKNAPAQLVIRLRDPFQGGPLQVRCSAPLVSNTPWTLPGLRLVNAVPRGEDLVLRVHPGILLEDWQPAGFRTVRATFQPDGWQVLNLAAGLDSGPNPARPTARIQTPGPDFKVRQFTWLQIGSERWSLSSQLDFDVVRDRLFALAVVVPTGWEVEQVTTTPPEILRDWSVATEKGRTTLAAELQHPLEAGAVARLTIQARPNGARTVPAAGLNLPLPDLAPVGARVRDGGVGLRVAALYQVTANASVAPVLFEPIAEPLAKEGPARPRLPAPLPPWGKQPPDFFFPSQGQGVTGSVNLKPRPTELRARCATDVVVASGRALALTRLELRPEVGAPRTLELFVSGPDPGTWDWKTVRGANPVARVERSRAAQLAPVGGVLAARNALQALAALKVPLRGNWWRLTFAAPLQEPVIVESVVELTDQAAGGEPQVRALAIGSERAIAAALLATVGQLLADQASRERRWDVPLVTVPAADRLEGQVTLHLAGSDLLRVQADGLIEVTDAVRLEKEPALSLPSWAPASAWRTFRYGHAPIALTLRGAIPTADRSTEAVVDRTSLTTHLGPGQQLVHHFRFQVWNWRQQRLPIRLPAGVVLQAARADSRWLDRLLPTETGDGSTLYELPVTAGANLHRFEIVYATTLPSWTLWTRLDAPVPVLPLRPVTFQRSWRLPPGVVPLGEGTWRRLSPSSWPAAAPAAAAVAPDWATRQEQVLTSGVAALRKQYKPGDSWALGRLLERLLFEQLKDQPLVIDNRALRSAGVGPASRLGPECWERSSAATPRAGGLLTTAPWEYLGLVYLPSRPAVLLTTRAQLALWHSAGTDLPRETEEALAEAVAFGHDRSGRFRTVPDWLEQQEQRLEDGQPEATDTSRLAGADWTEWEPLAGADAGPALLVVKSGAVPVASGVAGTLLLLLALRFAPRTERRRRRLALVWVAGAGLLLLWLPPSLQVLALGPALAGMFSAIVWTARPIRSAAAPAAGVSAMLAACLLVPNLPGQVAAPAPTTVYLVPDPAGRPDKQFVLAPPELLEQLQSLAQRGVASLRGALLLGAVYDGRVDNGASFEARYQVHSFSDEALLAVPLAGVQLTEALLDGAPAQPEHRPETKLLRERYVVLVKGKGPHTLIMRFGVSLPTAAKERDLRFSIPELLQSRLALRITGPTTFLHVAEARGFQRATLVKKQSQLEADLGSTPQLRVRWRTDDAKDQAVVEVKEAYYWELKASSASLMAVLQYKVNQGWASNFEVELPPDIEVRSAESGPVPGGLAAPRLREWSLKTVGTKRRLNLVFQTPVTSSVQVTLELVPRQPFGRTAVLPFPTPLNATQLEGFLAYRSDGIEASVAQQYAITGIKKEMQAAAFAEQFAQPWRLARDVDPEQPSRAFARSKGGLLHLILRPPAAQARWNQEVSWRVGRQQATVQAKAQLVPGETSPALVEWEVPAALTVIDVSGPNIHHWTRSGPRLQVWLHRPAADTTLLLNAALPRAPKETGVFNLPMLRILDAQKQTATVRVSSADDLILTPGNLQNLVAQTDPKSAGREWAFLAEQDTYGGSFKTALSAVAADFCLLTFAEVHGRELVVVARLDCFIQRGELRNLVVTVRNWDGSMTLDAPDVQRQLEQQIGSSGKAWALDLKPGIQRHYQLRLTGRLPLGSVPALFLPDIRVETSGVGPQRLERWLAVAGHDLGPESASGLVPGSPAELAQNWPGESERLRKAGGSAWHIASDDWRLRLRPRLQAPRAVPVQLFLAEHSAIVADERHWLHQATYWLYHEAGADLSVVLPKDARLLGVAINGAGVPPLQPGADRLWLPLPGGAGVRTVQLCWSYPDGKEDFDQPNLAGPLLEGLPDAPAVWRVALPTGYQSLRRPASVKAKTVHARPVSAPGFDLARADVQLQLMSWLLERARDSADRALAVQVLAAQERFERGCRRAEYQLSGPAATATDLGPDDQPLAAWLQELRQREDELTTDGALEPVQKLARSGPGRTAEPVRTGSGSPWTISALDRGRPLYWYGAAGEAPPRLRLLAEGAARSRQALTMSTLLLILLFASWILSRTFRTAWAEQLALLGAIGFLLFGSTWGLLFLLLPAFWLGLRFVEMARGLQHLIQPIFRTPGSAPPAIP